MDEKTHPTDNVDAVALHALGLANGDYDEARRLLTTASEGLTTAEGFLGEIAAAEGADPAPPQP